MILLKIPSFCLSAPVKGRKRKSKSEPKKPAAKVAKSKGKQEKITDSFKVKRKVDRFNGVSEAELLTKTLPDILTFNLDIVIVSHVQESYLSKITFVANSDSGLLINAQWVDVSSLQQGHPAVLRVFDAAQNGHKSFISPCISETFQIPV